jgi:hypothetical protein
MAILRLACSTGEDKRGKNCHVCPLPTLCLTGAGGNTSGFRLQPPSSQRASLDGYQRGPPARRSSGEQGEIRVGAYGDSVICMYSLLEWTNSYGSVVVDS